MKKLILSAGILLTSLAAMAQSCPEPFFSEYIEGSSNNKAIEVYNPGNVSIDLENYKIQIFANGAIIPTNTLFPIGILEAHDVFVIANGAAAAGIMDVKDTTSSVANFNGDDALIMINIITEDTVDIFGVVGVDPGSSWPVVGGTTVNQTLTRQFAITAGETDWAIGATQWDVHPIDMFDSLGAHSAAVIAPTIVADWTSTAVDLTVNFTDASAGLVSTYAWDFGDGSTSDLANPEHVYAAGGDYTVCLIVGGCDLPDTLCSVISICEPVFAGYSNVSDALTATFTNESTGGDLSYFWDFGDGSTSTDADPVHVYDEAGTYTACMIAYSDCDADTTCTTITIVCDLPVAAYSLETSGLTIMFTNESLFDDDQVWDFGDGTNSIEADPTHTYAVNGTYIVCLTVTNVCGSAIFCDTITVCDIIGAGFTTSQSAFDVDFTNGSTGTVATYDWDFGDGATSTDENPTHTYGTDGEYTICLTITNDCLESDSICETVTINTASVDENALSQVQVYPNPFTTAFTLNLGNSVDQVNVVITDINGRIIENVTANQSAILTFDLDVDGGVYFVKITSGNEFSVIKIIKE